jgi:hypothetical protein
MSSWPVLLRGLAALFALTLAVPHIVHAAEETPAQSDGQATSEGEGTDEQEGPPPANLECHGEAVEGSGKGFLSSQDASEEAAINDWLEKAKKQDPLTAWETAGKADLTCAKQGLYSKCFATGIPCHLRK